MTIKELKREIENIDDNFEILVSVSEGTGYPFDHVKYSLEKGIDIGFSDEKVILTATDKY